MTNTSSTRPIPTFRRHWFRLKCKGGRLFTMEEMVNKLPGIKMEFEVERMEPLFASQEEYDAFCKRHDSHCVKTAPLETYTGNCFLGIDAGSTTTKPPSSERRLFLYSGSLCQQQPQKTPSIKEVWAANWKVRTLVLPPVRRSLNARSSGGGGGVGRGRTLRRRFLGSEGRLNPRYRRSGYEMYQNQKSDRGQRTVKRSLFLWLRFLY